MSNSLIINEILKVKNISMHYLEKSLDLSNGTLRKSIARQGQLKNETIVKLLELFPDLNEQAIRKGQGSLFLENTIKSDAHEQLITGLDLIEKVEFTEFRKLKRDRCIVITPFVANKFQQVYSIRYNDPKFIEALPLHAVTINRNDSEEYRSFEVTIEFSSPDSNYTLHPGMIVTGRKWEINQISLLEVMIDTIFVVVTASGIIISKFYDYDETIGCILGDNPTTNESLPIPADEILELYEVVILTQY